VHGTCATLHRHTDTVSSKPRGPPVSPAECAHLCSVLGRGCEAWHHDAAAVTPTATAACTLVGAGIAAAADVHGLDYSGGGRWRHAAGDGSGAIIRKSASALAARGNVPRQAVGL